jgi:hypothetical protein
MVVEACPRSAWWTHGMPIVATVTVRRNDGEWRQHREWLKVETRQRGGVGYG